MIPTQATKPRLPLSVDAIEAIHKFFSTSLPFEEPTYFIKAYLINTTYFAAIWPNMSSITESV